MAGDPVRGSPEVVTGAAVPSVTTCRIAAEVLLVAVAASPDRAVMECSPTVSLEVAKVAWPATNGAVPSGFDPSKKVTLPGVVDPGPVTVAVSSTTWPGCEGFDEDVTVVAGVPPV